jgi:hypothetical protein
MFHPEIVEVLLFEFPVVEPFLHLLDEGDDAFGFEGEQLLDFNVLHQI